MSTAWRGRGLFERDTWQCALSTPEAIALNALTERTSDRDPESITRAADHFGATDEGALRGGMRPSQ